MGTSRKIQSEIPLISEMKIINAFKEQKNG